MGGFGFPNERSAQGSFLIYEAVRLVCSLGIASIIPALKNKQKSRRPFQKAFPALGEAHLPSRIKVAWRPHSVAAMGNYGATRMSSISL